MKLMHYITKTGTKPIENNYQKWANSVKVVKKQWLFNDDGSAIDREREKK